MKVVILGAGGMLGSALIGTFREHEIVAFNKSELDITKIEDLKKIKGAKPDVVINAAAYTNVDGAEDNKEEAFSVNADAVGHIAAICKEIGCIFIHYSTDYVFNENKKGYAEDDEKDPVNVYGESKARGEEMLRRNMEKYYIVRTSGLFGSNGKNFVDTIIATAQKQQPLRIVTDQFVTPTYTNDLAAATKNLIGKQYGIYHLVNEGACSWFAFAQEIIRIKHLNTELLPLTSEQLARKAVRPRCPALKNTKAKKLQRWELALNDYLCQ